MSIDRSHTYTILDGIVEGHRRKGRHTLEYVKQIVNDVRCSRYCEIKTLAPDRSGWRAASTSIRTADYNNNINNNFIDLHRLASNKGFNKKSF